VFARGQAGLPSGQTTQVTWHLDRNDVGFYDNGGHFVVEPGTIEVYVGDSSDADLKDTFTVQ
jgi:beta-glucosidase